MSDEKKNSDKSKPSVNFQAYSEALDRMFEGKTVEEQIEQIEKLAAIGELPGDNPHDATDD